MGSKMCNEWTVLFTYCVSYVLSDHDTLDFEKSKLAKAYADLKFVYVITCQIYGQQKAKLDPKAVDILHLLKEYDIKFGLSCGSTDLRVGFNLFCLYYRNEGLRVAYIHEVDKDYYSKLVKSDGDKDQVLQFIIMVRVFGILEMLI